MASETFADKKWKPIFLLCKDDTSRIDTYKDAGGVCYAGKVVTRTGQTFASGDVIVVQAATDEPLGICVEIIHADRTDWDFDEAANDNDVVKVAPLGSRHVVAAFMLSAQGDVTAGRLLYADDAGNVKPAPLAAAAGDSVDIATQISSRAIGRLYEDCPESTSDPKKNVLCKVILNV